MDKWTKLECTWKSYAESYESYDAEEWRQNLLFEDEIGRGDKQLNMKFKDRLLIADLVKAQIANLVENETNPDESFWKEIRDMMDLHRRIVALQRTRGGSYSPDIYHPANKMKAQWTLEDGTVIKGTIVYAKEISKKHNSPVCQRDYIHHEKNGWPTREAMGRHIVSKDQPCWRWLRAI